MPATKKSEHGFTRKEEIAILEYMRHGVEIRAFCAAYNAKHVSWARVEACRFFGREDVRRRIGQLHAQSEAGALYDHKQCLLEAHEAWLIARETGDARGMTAASMLKAKVSGLIVEKSLNVVASIGSQSNEELQAEHARINEQLQSLGHQPLPPLRLLGAGGAGPRVVAGESKEIHRERVANN